MKTYREHNNKLIKWYGVFHINISLNNIITIHKVIIFKCRFIGKQHSAQQINNNKTLWYSSWYHLLDPSQSSQASFKFVLSNYTSGLSHHITLVIKLKRSKRGHILNANMGSNQHTCTMISYIYNLLMYIWQSLWIVSFSFQVHHEFCKELKTIGCWWICLIHCIYSDTEFYTLQYQSVFPTVNIDQF